MITLNWSVQLQNRLVLFLNQYERNYYLLMWSRRMSRAGLGHSVLTRAWNGKDYNRICQRLQLGLCVIFWRRCIFGLVVIMIGITWKFQLRWIAWASRLEIQGNLSFWPIGMRLVVYYRSIFIRSKLRENLYFSSEISTWTLSFQILVQPWIAN